MNSTSILHALSLSTAAYRDVQPCPTRHPAARIDSPSGVQCFLRTQGERRLLITFRGSDSPADWKTNLTFWKKKIPYDNAASAIRVHTGFIDAYKAPGVRERILEAASGARFIRITGHSQGAALAVLCAVDIEYNYPDRDIEAVLFGCPRVGNRAFMTSYNKRVWKTVRVENGNDIVTKLPFPFMGYRHVGARLPVGKPRLPGCFSANDHYPHAYYSSVLRRLLG